MKRSGKYVINFGSLPDDFHEFEFEVTDSFFDQYENSIVHKGTVDVLVTLEKKQNMLLLDFTMDGVITVQCDRCLEDLDIDISSYNELIVKLGEERGEESEDVIILPSKDHELDVSQYIYEYINVLVPLRNVHPDDENGNSTCNPDILKAIEKYRIHEEEEKPADPRWEGLKGINLN